MTQPLLTAEQVVSRYGLPSTRTVRSMRQKGMRHVRISKAYLYEAEDVEAYIEQNKVAQCPGETQARSSNGSKSATATMPHGTRADAKNSILLAQQTSQKLKRLSRTSCANDSDSNDRIVRVNPRR